MMWVALNLLVLLILLVRLLAAFLMEFSFPTAGMTVFPVVSVCVFTLRLGFTVLLISLIFSVLVVSLLARLSILTLLTIIVVSPLARLLLLVVRLWLAIGVVRVELAISLLLWLVLWILSTIEGNGLSVGVMLHSSDLLFLEYTLSFLLLSNIDF